MLHIGTDNGLLWDMLLQLVLGVAQAIFLTIPKIAGAASGVRNGTGVD